MRSLRSVAIVVALVPLVLAQEKPEKDDNPFRKAKVGDWVEYKMTTSFGGNNIEGKVKMTVTEKTDKEATIKTTAAVNGMDVPGQETKIDLSKAYDPSGGANLPKGSDVKTEKEDDGKEKIKIGDKEYDCTWTKNKVTGKANGVEIEGEVKVWIAKDAPLSGMVKMENSSKVMGNVIMMTMEYVGSGSK